MKKKTVGNSSNRSSISRIIITRLLLLGLASIAYTDLVIRPSDHVLLGTDYHLYTTKHVNRVPDSEPVVFC
jgi:hypothetical protein